jgi:hypothetical protein
MDQRPNIRRLAFRSACAALCLGVAIPSPLVAQTRGYDTTVVEGITVLGPVSPPNVGAGAPNFSVEELDAQIEEARLRERNARWARSQRPERWRDPYSLDTLCRTEFEAQAEVIRTAEIARAATEAAMSARQGAAIGEATQQQLESAELARQAAVNDYMAARMVSERARLRIDDYVELDASLVGQAGVPVEFRDAEIELRTSARAEGEGFVISRTWDDLGVGDVAAEVIGDTASSGLAIAGRIYNQRKSDVAVPPLQVLVYDRGGFLLQRVDIRAAGGARIPAGEAVTFGYRLEPAPENVVYATVTFGPYSRISQIAPRSCRDQRIARPGARFPSADDIMNPRNGRIRGALWP